MDNAVKDFIEELDTKLHTLCAEVQKGAASLKDDMKTAVKQFHRDPGMADTIIGRHILSHRYGELLAIRFRKWIHEKFEIGASDAPCPLEEVLP